MADSPSQEQPTLFDPHTSVSTNDSLTLKRKFQWQYVALNILIVFFFGLLLFLLYGIVSPFFVTKEIKNVLPVLSKTVQVDILNASGVSGIGMKLTRQLRTRGVDVIDVGNFSTETNESFIIDRLGSRRDAVIFSRIVGIDSNKIIQQISRDYLVNLSLVVGKDYQKYFTNNLKEYD
ncbi:MAG: LytR C-terminal domain-containing protein [Ignavibacteriales bacterium]|nr:LytR C-terminal domain-containing protein [Ignavibacteriales bacterium]